MPNKKPNFKGRPKMDMGIMRRVLKDLFRFYPVMAPLTAAGIIFSAIVSVIPAIFLQQVTDTIDKILKNPDCGLSWSHDIVPKVILLIVFYVLSIISVTVETQLAAIITQGFLGKMRKSMFNGMQDLPIKYFDTHRHGDIMSYYTNDIDTLRQLVGQSFPTLIRAGVIVLGVFFVMLWFSIPLTALIVGGVFLMFLVSGRLGGGSARYFMSLQRTVGRAEGYVQEMMNGQKVVKVFCREGKSIEGYDEINEELFTQAYKANANANMLAPIIMNIGNVIYVVVTIVGCLMLIGGVGNVSVGSIFHGVSPMAVSIIVTFLSMTKQFTGNVNQVSQQINSVVMAMAGAKRIYDLVDEKPEEDEGYVTLVDAEIAPDGTITEADHRTGHWAWKHPHSADGTVTYTLLQGDVRMNNVDFAYVEGKTVLHDVSLFAEPGQKVAFVGATGAGKTTITNLINRFYDIADGKIRYDGININKIKKSDLRRSLGIVLQETNLFTGTVMENIRYGKLDATDEECIEAARLAGADDFITRLPEGYETKLTGNGSNLSQGQRQLISIARAAVADPPVMILDEATSSIDTRTEAIVQRGMDKLMEGRTVFVIAHRLSTVMNSDVIMVLDHGRIIERGNHEQLIAERGVYYKLYTGSFELE
ncbi:MAG: ABC transporter ATP-binding protein [Clostridia bacterium]|nr:ABC transporter ATP-binding protein [Clostridia bacterium]